VKSSALSISFVGGEAKKEAALDHLVGFGEQ